MPFPEDALADKEVQESVLGIVMRRLAKDPRCTVHRVLLPVREPRPGWIHIAAPSSPACPDEGQLFGEMVSQIKCTINVAKGGCNTYSTDVNEIIVEGFCIF